MSDKQNIVPFDGTKYNIWKCRVRMLIQETILNKNALSIIDNVSRPENVDIDDWLKWNILAKGIIVKNLDDSTVGYATNDPTLTAREIFEQLDNLYNRKSIANELNLELKLSNFKYNDNTGDLTKHMSEFDELINDYETASGEKLKEAYKIARLLHSLPKQYKPLVLAIRTLPESNLNLPNVKVRILEYEIQLNYEDNDNTTKILRASTSYSNNNNTNKSFKNRKYYNNFKSKTNKRYTGNNYKSTYKSLEN